MSNMSLTISLKQRWEQLCQRLDIARHSCDKWFSVIEQKYSESQRYYHTLRHLETMFSYFDIWKVKLNKPDDVLLAIYFHDLVYDPTSSENEERSIDLFEEFCISNAQQIRKDMKEFVIYLIRTTKTHNTDDIKEDLCYFLDFDMAILSCEEKEYSEYAGNIRKEYSHFKDDVFNTKRRAVLEDFLKREHIYSTKTFQDLYEYKAKENISKEISLLRN